MFAATAVPPPSPERDPPPGGRDAGAEWRRNRILLVIIAVLAVLASLHVARGLLIPIALSFFFAALLSPLVNRLRRWRVPRVVGAGLVLLVMVGTVAGLIDSTVDPAREWLNRAPGVLREIERKIRPLQKVAVQLDAVAAHAERVADGSDASQASVAAPPRRQMLLLQTPAMAVTVAGTFFLTFFLLAWGPPLLAKIAGGVNDPRADRALRIVETAQQEIAQYLGTIAIINVCLGLATFGITMAFGLPTPMLWGVLAATLNFIPYAGSAVTLAVITIVALLTQDGVGPAVGVALSYLALATVEGQLVQPLAVGRRLSLNPLLVFLALWVWGWLWGVAGMLLATPMLLALKALSCQVGGMERVARILSPSPAPSRVQVAADRLRRKPAPR
jgi:predicted PurR-regulated permease PerM